MKFVHQRPETRIAVQRFELAQVPKHQGVAGWVAAFAAMTGK
jgi:hypothetical protein